MAMTLRLPAHLEAEAAAYARSLGLSVTGLVAVALREYLDARPTPPVVDAAGEPELSTAAAAPLTQAAAVGNSASKPRAPVSAGKLSPAERLRAKAQAKRVAAGSAS